MLRLTLNAKSRLPLLAVLLAPPVILAGCGDVIQNDYHHNFYGDGGAGAEPVAPKGGSAPKPAPVAGTGTGGASDGGAAGDPESAGAAGEDSGIDPRYPDAPLADVTVAEQTLDIFGTVGNRYWFGVSDEQREAMNQGRWGGGGPIFNGGIYQPGGADGSANYVDHLWVTTAGDEPRTADYGQVQVKVVGQSSYQTWDAANIPNLNVDADQFVKDQRLAGYEHLRFSNGQVGSIFRDRVVYDMYRALGYPAPLATYAWVSSNVWGPDISIPYILVERYKQAFCARYAVEFGGGCTNMWEFYGDFNAYYGGGKMDILPGPIPGPGFPGQGSVFDSPENCQLDKCDNTRVKQLEQKLAETPSGDGFKAATSEYIDWPAYHRFQCLSWIFGTSDDPIHANNNVVLVERHDGLFQYLPYSVDISLGFSGTVSLTGQNVLSSRCQADASCWAGTLNACEDLIADFTELEPNKVLKAIYDQLDEHGMLRAGDEGRYQAIDAYFTERLAALPVELEYYREGGMCQYPEVECNGYCAYLECPDHCVPPDKPLPADGFAGAPAMGGAGGAGAVGGAFAMGGGMGVAGAVGMGGVGGGPIECPPIEKYRVAE